MQIERFILGPYQTNSYIARNDDSKDCLVIDTGLESEPLLNALQTQKLNPQALLLTHGHIDHIAGVDLIKEIYPDIKVYIHPDDADMLVDPLKNLSAMFGQGFATSPADELVEDDQEIEISSIKLKVLHTPGHTPGGVAYYCESENVLFAGDTLFEESIGRSDFPGGDPGQLTKSIKEKLFTLADNTTVLPGHGEQTTIGHEKKYNPFIR